LKGDTTFLEPRNIDMPVGISLQKVSVPEEGVGMKVGYEERLMKRLGFFRDRIWPRRNRIIGNPIIQSRNKGAREWNQNKYSKKDSF
jgi:hypothetical protein